MYAKATPVGTVIVVGTDDKPYKPEEILSRASEAGAYSCDGNKTSYRVVLEEEPDRVKEFTRSTIYLL
ncbi:MAG: hypothetical protein KBD73_02760 [Candidatus Magasanikbacteria bacterium]|jgi:hypothetical protein|nr:hypothetical protein [Candidatus Magasanikbacteria bacterium]